MEILLGLSLFGVGFLVTLIVPILGWVRAAQALNEVRQLRARIGALEHELKDLATTRGVAARTAESAAPASPATATPPSTEVHPAREPVAAPAQPIAAAPPATESVPVTTAEPEPLPQPNEGTPVPIAQPKR